MPPEKSMELKEFIKSSVQSIVDACNDLKEDNVDTEVLINPTQSSADSNDGFVNHNGELVPISKIDFELAVTVDASDKVEGGAKISVLAANLGGSGNTETKQSEASRISFSLRVTLPYTKTVYKWGSD